MKSSKDNFSTDSAAYKKYRPAYPDAVYELVLQHVNGREQAWDCGTGNGQVALELAEHFNKVFATDLSANQLAAAPPHPGIEYGVAHSEKSGFPDHSFDLVTAAQALHWFDFQAFSRELRRVLKPEGIFAAWGYGLIESQKEINQQIRRFYHDIVGPYWDPERRHVDKHYQSIRLDLEEVPLEYSIIHEDSWGIDHMKGYLNTWSAVKHYALETGENPIDVFMQELAEVWPEGEELSVRFPIFIRIFRP